MTIPAAEIARFLATGCSDQVGRGTGDSILEELQSYNVELRNALLAEVKSRESGLPVASPPPGIDLIPFTRRRVAPMVRGLFRKDEQRIVLRMAEKSVVFLTRDATHRLIMDMTFRNDAWMIANIYLGSLGLPGLDGKHPPLTYNVNTTCYVSLAFFGEKDKFADYIVHQVAHIFHDCKRQTLGLPFLAHKERLLDIEFRMRNLFAYACEVYSRILKMGKTVAERRRLLDELSEELAPGNAELNQEELLDILREAVGARNGWKQILGRCSPRKKPESAAKD